MHSNFSSGARTISDMARTAKDQNIQAIILTDLYQEHYEYGIVPFQSFIKKNFNRDSIMKHGAGNYLKAIEEAGRDTKEVLLIDGTAATPFYYWSGGILPGPLVMNNRAKDLLVLGLGSEEKYQDLPVTGNKSSRFTPYDGDAFAQPYQKFIDEAKSRGALVFWSHPKANEHIFLHNVVLGLDVYLDTPSYESAMLETFRYNGFGIFPTDLALMTLPDHVSMASPGQIWDQVLQQYCEGKRHEPAWVIGEADYNGFPQGIRDMDGILNMVYAPAVKRNEILSALGKGRLYVTIPASHTERILLDEFSVSSETGVKAGMGETLPVSGMPLIHLRAHLSEEVARDVKILLLRNGEVITQWNETLPFDLQYQDRAPRTGKSYYRVVLYSETSPHRMVTNPIFLEHS